MIASLLFCAVTCISCSEQASEINYSTGGNTWLSETDSFLTGVTYHSDPGGEIRVVFIKNFTGSSLPSIQSSLEKKENGSFVYKINDLEVSVNGDITVIIMGNKTTPQKVSIERKQIGVFLNKLKDGTYGKEDVLDFYNELIKPKSSP